MDEDLRNAFATLSAQISVVATDLRANTSLTADLTRSVAEVRTEQKSQAGRLTVVEKHIFGSDPPPPPTRPLAESIGDHEGEIATLEGQVIAVRAELAEVRKQNAEQLEMLATIAKALGNPWVKRVAYALGSIIVGYATAKGFLR